MGTLTSPVQKMTFALSDVQPARFRLPEVPYLKGVGNRLRGPVEGCSKRSGSLVSTDSHAFVATVHAAFNDHRPLILSPDHFWLLICQGFATHVRAHAESLRDLLVHHEGTKELSIVRPDIAKGQPDAPWDEAVADFAGLIRQNLTSEFHMLLTPRFSTTTPIETTAFEIVLMDSVQDYFDYGMSLCGIPSITLEGSPDDWRTLQEHTRTMGAFQLDWWTMLLDPILSELVQTAEGNINKSFWEDLYKYHSESGRADRLTGWLVKFFPYIETPARSGSDGKTSYRVNRYLEHDPADKSTEGFDQGMLSGGLSRTPFHWDHGDAIYKMEFVAGFVGMTQDAESNAIRPEIGWAVRDIGVAKAGRMPRDWWLADDLD